LGEVCKQVHEVESIRIIITSEGDENGSVMILATSSNDDAAFTFSATVNGLAIYLDNWAVIDLAEGDALRRRRFVDSVCNGGTLLFSAANALELAGQKGESLEIIKSFLDELGPRWLPIEFNPLKVVERERRGMGLASSLSRGFMIAYFKNRTAQYSPRSGKVIDLSHDFFRLGAVVDWVAGNESLPKQSQQFDEVLKTVSKNQAGYKQNHRLWLDQKFPAQKFNPSRRATFVLQNLVRTLVVESGQLTTGDGMDLCHAVMGSAFASVAALDRNWKRRVENLPKPNELAHIYSAPDLNTMVTDIESCVKQNTAHCLIGGGPGELRVGL
jgi:hypothetical protein